MRDMQDQKQNFDLLDRTLENFGADPARWPAGVQNNVLSFVNGNAEAQRRIAQARALDKVLSFASNISDARQAALADRIVSRAIRQPRVAAPGELSATPLRNPPAVTRSTSSWSQALTAGTLAASLLLGILAGQTATVLTLAETVLSDGEGLASSMQQIAQSDDIEGFFDEDLL